MPFGRRLPILWWFAALVVAVALPLLALLAWGFATAVQRERAEAREAALRMARDTAAKMRTLHRESLDLLDRMAQRPAIRDFSGGDCDAFFSIVDYFPQYVNVLFFDRGGRVLCAAPVLSAADRAVSSEAKVWIGDALRRGALPLRVPMIRTIDGQWVSAVSVAVPRGVLTLVQLPQIAGRDILPASAVVTIADREGRIVARTPDSARWTGRSAAGSEIVRVVRSRKEGSTDAVGIDGVARQYGFTDVPEIGWYVYVGIPAGRVMHQVRATIARGVATGALLIALIAVTATVLSRAITRPLENVSRGVSRVAAGGYEPLPVEGPAEIASVAAAVNNMIERRLGHERQIAETHRQLRALSDRLLASQEEERAWLAREIHDELGQSLTALKMDIIGLLRDTPPERATIRERILRTLDDTVTSVQRITSELRPPLLDDLGLVAAIESEARLFEERSGIECELSLPPQAPPLEKATATTVYRVVQEALTNVMRHADASRVELRMRVRDQGLIVDIRDDGRGATPRELESADSFGLAGMRERAVMAGGSVTITGVEGRGTIVSVQVPLKTDRGDP